jgi:hypothetical protein
LVQIDDESKFQFGFLIIFLKLKSDETVIIYKPINYNIEDNEEKTANFFLLPKNYDLFSVQMDENGMIELEMSVWSGLIESTPNEPNLG